MLSDLKNWSQMYGLLCYGNKNLIWFLFIKCSFLAACSHAYFEWPHTSVNKPDVYDDYLSVEIDFQTDLRVLIQAKYLYFRSTEYLFVNVIRERKI